MKRIDCPIELSELRRLYHVEKLTDHAIAERIGNGATVKRVRSWRKHAGIETINRTERHDVTPIEGRLRSVLIGSMLGDGTLAHPSGTTVTRYREFHCEAQRAYLDWKMSEWGVWVKGDPKPSVTERDGELYPGWYFHTVGHRTLNEWFEFFYDGQWGTHQNRNNKHFRNLDPASVDALALAIWYLDDGFAGWWPEICFGAQDASRVKALEVFERFGLTPRWVLAKKTTGAFHFEGVEQAQRLVSLIEAHVPECMQYKLTFGYQGPHYQVRQRLPEATLRDLAAKGEPIMRIARMLGVGATTVQRYLRRFEIDHERRVGRPPVVRMECGSSEGDQK